MRTKQRDRQKEIKRERERIKGVKDVNSEDTNVIETLYRRCTCSDKNSFAYLGCFKDVMVGVKP